ncbi:MAG: DNA-binding protein [Aquabacterium sp.]|jgi:DNA repair exonuclease SbcCD ATPase subunit|uniref:DNA-binding protein n=1 Tax=Aquabacterium sp. TaxID=1872578 RepID=UPI001DE22D6D|nr:DNA-binding protein [Aquabacterium sp.]MBT9610810.1 DNA-binding protein [Aquabacterium sp.]
MSTETEILSEVEALKERFSDTRALYREVCALLFFRHGITPTANKLYQYVRKGSMSTPTEALAKFWDELRSKARIEIDHPDLPADLKTVAAEAIASLWRQATETARGELDAIRLEAQAKAQQAQHDAAAALRQTEQAEATLRTQKSEATQLQAELDALRLEHAATQARLNEIQTQLAGAQAQLQLAQKGFHAELARARESAQAAEGRAAASHKRALLDIEQERQARVKADKLTDTLRSQVAQADQRSRQMELVHAELMTKLTVQHDAALASLAQAKQAERLSTEQLAAAQEALKSRESDIAALRAESQTLKMVLDRSANADSPAPSPTRRRRSG